jgi:hypothetical protein
VVFELSAAAAAGQEARAWWWRQRRHCCHCTATWYGCAPTPPETSDGGAIADHKQSRQWWCVLRPSNGLCRTTPLVVALKGTVITGFLELVR